MRSFHLQAGPVGVVAAGQRFALVVFGRLDRVGNERVVALRPNHVARLLADRRSAA
jgi:hypothetical protein